MLAKNTVLACDLGGTTIKLGLVRDGRVFAHAEIDAEPGSGLGDALERVLEQTDVLLRSNHQSRGDLKAFGLAFPGIVAPKEEKILSSPAGKFDDAAHFDVHRWAREQLGCSAAICNDANAALAGEVKSGAARDQQNAVMVTLGTGFGSAVMMEGSLLRGRHGQAGSLGGHLSLNFRGRICCCGNVGCLETAASTWALPELLAEQPGSGESPLSRESKLGYEAVFRWAARGDLVAIALRDQSLQVWAAGIVNLIHAYDPEVVVIGGGIMRSAGVILPSIRAYVQRHAWTPWGQVEVRAAELGSDAALIGMAALIEAKSVKAPA